MIESRMTLVVRGTDISYFEATERALLAMPGRVRWPWEFEPGSPLEVAGRRVVGSFLGIPILLKVREKPDENQGGTSEA